MKVLITGGTGSLGKILTKTLLNNNEIERLVIFSRDELKQWEMQNTFKDKRIRYFIGDIRDKDRINKAMRGITHVFHTAALKQITTCEYEPYEAIKTNILGSQNVIDACIENKVEKVIALSTDKAVDPVNHYGATKKVAEGLFVEANVLGNKNTIFSSVRYGNVLASRGSVVQLFKDQAKLNYITITDPKMTRFWWTLKNASDFVIHCLNIMKGGEIFIPKIGSSTVLQLADIIAPSATKKIIGIRAGEKLHEILISQHEMAKTYDLGELYAIYPDFPFFTFPNYDRSNPINLISGYTSDKINLTKEELKNLIKESEEC